MESEIAMCNKKFKLPMTGPYSSDDVRLQTGWKDQREGEPITYESDVNALLGLSSSGTLRCMLFFECKEILRDEIEGNRQTT